jgi:hypothetical protein
MSLDHNTFIPNNGLVFCLDPANSRSYSGSGNTVYNLAGGSSIGATKSSGVTYNSTAPATFSSTASNYLISDYTLASGTSFTVSMWFKRVDSTYWVSLFGNEVWNSGTGYVARLESSTLITFSRATDLIGISYDNAALVSANYNHYVFVKNTSGTDSFIYLNGVQVANGSINNVSISKPFVFNTRYTNDGSSLTDSRGSQFSHIAVYSRALSATEVKQIYNATKRRFGY